MPVVTPNVYWQQCAAQCWQSSRQMIASGNYEGAKQQQDIAARTYSHARWWMNLENGRPRWSEAQTHTDQPKLE